MPTQTPAPQTYRAFEHAGWEGAASAYADTFERATRLFAGAIAQAARIGPGSRVLDVACGTGCLTALAAGRGATVTGTDFSPAMVTEARRLHPSLRFDVADAESLPFEDAAFDVVVIHFGIHHFTHPVRALAEAHRVLRSGGVVAFTVWAAPDDHALHRIALAAARRAGNAAASLPLPPGGAVNDPGLCAQLLVDAGFGRGAPTVERHCADLWLDSAADLQHLIRAGTVRMAALISSQAPERQAAILEAIADEAARYLDSGRLRVPVVALLACASKWR